MERSPTSDSGRKVANRVGLWLLLAAPAAWIFGALTGGGWQMMDALKVSGETSFRLMIAAMLVGPLVDAFGRSRLLTAWLRVRRDIGVAACAYAVLHLLFYVVDMGALAPIVDELVFPAIWTGWLGFAFVLAAGAISNDYAVRLLGRSWKRIQQGLYAAFLLILAHWVLLDRTWIAPLIHAAPLIIAWGLRALATGPKRRRGKA